MMVLIDKLKEHIYEWWCDEISPNLAKEDNFTTSTKKVILVKGRSLTCFCNRS